MYVFVMGWACFIYVFSEFWLFKKNFWNPSFIQFVIATRILMAKLCLVIYVIFDYIIYIYIYI